MSDARRAGWYYMQDGRLRWHDEHGWTQYYLDFDEIEHSEGHPPPPKSMLDEVLARNSERPAPARPWWRLWRP